MNISLYQFNPVWEDKKINQQRIAEYLLNLKLDTDVLIFPEMTLTGFTMRSKKYSETIDGETTQFFKTIAKKYNIHIFAGFIENVNEKYINSLIHVNRNGEVTNKYHKLHPFSFSGENRHYYSGNSPLIVQVDNLDIGLSICYDLRFPELYRYYGKNRVAAMINIANWPIERIEHWRHLLKARAIENLCYMIGVNRVGAHRNLEYNGRSGVYGPFGEKIVEMNNEEKITTIKIDEQIVNDTREKFPFLNDIKLI